MGPGAVFEALNRLPEAQHGADIMRVRPAALAGRARSVRQTILLASFASAELNALARGCANVTGRVRLQPVYKARAENITTSFERHPAALHSLACLYSEFSHNQHMLHHCLSFVASLHHQALMTCDCWSPMPCYHCVLYDDNELVAVTPWYRAKFTRAASAWQAVSVYATIEPRRVSHAGRAGRGAAARAAAV